jgi:nitroreductase/dihydropteridine reductase
LQKKEAMSIIDQLKWRYATKSFDTNKQLSDDQIQLLKEAFNLTATSYGLQTLKMVVVKDKALREKLLPYAYNQSQVVDASHLLILCIQTDINSRHVDLHFENVEKIRETPSEVLEPFKKQLSSSIEQMAPEERRAWARNQAYIALGNLMTVCAIEQIDSCPMEGFIPDEVDRALNLKKYGLNSVLMLPVGFRSEKDMFSSLKKVRKPIAETVIDL